MNHGFVYSNWKCEPPSLFVEPVRHLQTCRDFARAHGRRRASAGKQEQISAFQLLQGQSKTLFNKGRRVAQSKISGRIISCLFLNKKSKFEFLYSFCAKAHCCN